MPGTEQFTIGAEASCSDRVCGEVSRVVVDPLAHLVVEPGHRLGLGRLVPLGLVDVADGQIRLQSTVAQFARLNPAEENAAVGMGEGRVSQTAA